MSHRNIDFVLFFSPQASSLPVVIISNSSQQQSAWASVLWFNMLSQDPKVSKASDSSLKFNALLFSAQSVENFR